MMINPVEFITPFIRRYTVNLPDYVIESAILTGCNRFFIDAGIWLSEQDLSVHGNTVIAFPDQENAYIVRVHSAHTEDGKCVEARYTRGRVELGTDNDYEGIVSFKFVLSSSHTIAKIPQWALDNHHETIAHAALQKIKSSQGQPWLDPDGAVFHEMEYRHGMGETRILNTNNYVTIPKFA